MNVMKSGAAGLLVAAMLCATNAIAEKADRSRPIEIDAASGKSDLANNIQTLEGGVVLTQGTMRISAEKMIVRRDAQGNIAAELHGAGGNQISFREKREGFSDFMEGVADHAEFDQAANTVKLFKNAKLKNGNDILSGDYIYYNSSTDVMLADGRAPDGKFGKHSKPATAEPGGRVRIVIQPRTEQPPGSNAAPTKK